MNFLIIDGIFNKKLFQIYNLCIYVHFNISTVTYVTVEMYYRH